MNKPDWADAPEWAEWLAMDKDGSWYWYSLKPIADSDDWSYAGKIALAYDAPSFYDTREQRP